MPGPKETIRAKFTNQVRSTQRWVIFDVYAGRQVLDYTFASAESQDVNLETLGAFWGQAKYRKFEDTSPSAWTTVEQVLEGDEITMA
jgi:hypothetical protein